MQACTSHVAYVGSKANGTAQLRGIIHPILNRRYHSALGQAAPLQRRLARRPSLAASAVDERSPDPPPAKAAAWHWEESDDALRTYAVFLGLLGVGTLPVLQSEKLADLPYFIGLAVVTIYMGAHRGLNSRQRQQINLREGALAPVFASAALLGAYCLVKFFPDFNVQTFFDCYFWLVGSIAVVGAFAVPARRVGALLNQPEVTVALPEWTGVQDEAGLPLLTSTLCVSDLAVLAVGVAVASADLAAHHGNFTLNNLVACCLAADILQLVGLKSFRVAAVLLAGLLAYDVFWVFGSPGVMGDNVMLTVATTDLLTGPTRLIFPRVPGSVGEAASFPFSLLGLGDVAVPGLLACLALRYDASRAVDMRARGIAAGDAILEALASLAPDASGDEVADATGQAAEQAYDAIADVETEQRMRTEGASSSSSSTTVYLASDSVLQQRTYFGPVMVAYVAGLGVAFAANAITGLGQPALLYLVPLTLGAVAGVAAVRGDLKRVWSYSDTSAGEKGEGGKGA